ncbi:alpha/beta hydrolase [Alkanindiges illinoisensis]|uniref:alpha/beta hydrolase n=1 Tax=Alkanindiges illinoisensis TaxID=197183 RepID=UPI000684C93D|nr:alpha/beta fold hydrolase [Alkanindiges illinoisensis]
MTDIQIAAPAGSLQARALWQQSERIVLICHPHPLFGGTMDNKVVTTLARFFRNQNVSVVTFNFRGVGNSSGQHDNGIGEIDDALAVLNWIIQQNPFQNQSDSQPRQLYLAGFSFGAYIAAAVASRFNQQQINAELTEFKLVKTFLVAPPVHHYPMHDLSLATDTVVLMGDQDEVVPPAEVISWATQLDLQLVMMPGCSHFFHGHLPDLGQQLAQHFP